jgi:hypothetical protein
MKSGGVACTRRRAPVVLTRRSSRKPRHQDRLVRISGRAHWPVPWAAIGLSAVRGHVEQSAQRRRRRGKRHGSRAMSPAGGLRLLRVTGDQLAVGWSAVAGVASWQVLCWDGDDRPVARLVLDARHQRATFTGLAGLAAPFTIAVSGLTNTGSVRWQGGLADLTLRSDSRAGYRPVSAESPSRTRKRSKR